MGFGRFGEASTCGIAIPWPSCCIQYGDTIAAPNGRAWNRNPIQVGHGAARKPATTAPVVKAEPFVAWTPRNGAVAPNPGRS